MANRFVRRIKSGDIESVSELKSEFKEVAKLTHPDLRGGVGGPGAEEDFVAARTEYEAALRDFEKHRFGARPGSGHIRARDEMDGPLAEAVWLCLELLLKRGFPKVAKHEKERLRYEYARWRLEEALGTSRAELFRAFESELLDMKAFGSDILAPTLRLLGDLLEYRYAGVAAMRTHVVLMQGRLKADSRSGLANRGFMALLAGDLGIGGEINGGT